MLDPRPGATKLPGFADPKPSILKPGAKNMNFVHSVVHLKNPAGHSKFCQLHGAKFICTDPKSVEANDLFEVIETRAVGDMKKALTRQEINEKAAAAQKFFEQKGSYNLLSNNCNTTAEEFVRSLTGGSIGEDVTDPIAAFVVEEQQDGIRRLLNSPMVQDLVNIHQNPVGAEVEEAAESTEVRSEEVAAWGQCGGQEHTGGTKCTAGYTCVKTNEWFSQCKPRGGSGPGPEEERLAFTTVSEAPVKEKLNHILLRNKQVWFGEANRMLQEVLLEVERGGLDMDAVGRGEVTGDELHRKMSMIKSNFESLNRMLWNPPTAAMTSM